MPRRKPKKSQARKRYVPKVETAKRARSKRVVWNSDPLASAYEQIAALRERVARLEGHDDWI